MYFRRYQIQPKPPIRTVCFDMALNIEENKALIRRFFTAIERGNLTVFDQIVSEDYNDHLVGAEPGARKPQEVFHRTSYRFPRPGTADIKDGGREGSCGCSEPGQRYPQRRFPIGHADRQSNRRHGLSAISHRK